MAGIAGQIRTPDAPVRTRRNFDGLAENASFIGAGEVIQLNADGALQLVLNNTGGLENVAGELGIELDGTTLGLTGDGLAVNAAAVDHDSLLNYDASEHVDHTAVTITGDVSLTGGGDLATVSTISLVNDEASPGLSQYYGTDGALGTKGWYSLPVYSFDAPLVNASSTISLAIQHSLELDSGFLQLVNDEASPGANQVYGTGSGGVKGWKDDPVIFAAVLAPAANVTGSPVAAGTKWDLGTLSGGVGLSVDTGADTFTLQPGTYLLTAQTRMRMSTIGNGVAFAQFYDETNTAYVGTVNAMFAAGATGAQTQVPFIYYAVTLATATTFSLRFGGTTGTTAVDTLYAAGTAVIIQRSS